MIYTRRDFTKIGLSFFTWGMVKPDFEFQGSGNMNLVPGPVTTLEKLADFALYQEVDYFLVLQGGEEDGLYQKEGSELKLLKDTAINFKWLEKKEAAESIRLVINLNEAKHTHYSIYFPEGEYSINGEFECSNQVIWGEGTLVPQPKSNDLLIGLKGDGNEVVGLSFFEKSYCKVLLQIEGSHTIVKGCSFRKTNPSSTTKMVYSDKQLFLKSPNGNKNWVESCSFQNGRIGAQLEGNYTFTKCTISGCITGLLLRPSSYESTISHNKILDNQVNHASGADGILAQRNVTKLHIHHNEIRNSGEHGIYLQGDNCLLEENTVTENYRSGIKLASYNTNLHKHPGMNEDFYVGHHNVIRNNNCKNNCQDPKDTTNAGVYLQAPLRDLLVEGNDCSGNTYGIRSTSLSKLTKEEMSTKGQLRDLKFINNKALDTVKNSFYIEGETGIEVIGNEMDSMLTNSKDTSERIRGIQIKNNKIFQKLTLNRASGAVVTKNEIGLIVVVDNSKNGNHTIRNNK